MKLNRREFAASAFGAAIAGQFSTPALAQVALGPRPDFSAAVAAIRAQGEAHCTAFGLPGMTLGLTAPGGWSTVLNFGFANSDARTAITPATLFQIGSISKLMTAALIHQFAAEGKVRLADPLTSLLPTISLPPASAITVQQLLDHVAGLADDPPMFPKGGLWTGFKPGSRWSYSNTGYDILGKLAEHLGGRPLDQLLEQRLFAPLGMTRTKGAILGIDRPLYAQGYEAVDQTVPYARGVPLAPASWVDVTFGAGSVASTADDMIVMLRALLDAAQGRAALGLSPVQAHAFTAHAVPSDTPGMNYGNGLMHVGDGGRAYLHHTGGMIAFSSSFHLDVASGAGAFASSNLSGFAEYRPRLLTRFAADALTRTMLGHPLPPPPRLDVPLVNSSAYLGRYSGPDGDFSVVPGSPLNITAGGHTAALQPWSGDLFRTTHPHFRTFSLKFNRAAGAISGASWGPSNYARAGSNATFAPSDPALAKLAGRYVNDNPWYGSLTVVERSGKLWIGTDAPLVAIGDNLWRVGAESWSPERAAFADTIDGRPQTLIFSGEPFRRHDV